MTKGQLNLDRNYQLICDDDNYILQRRIPPTKKRKERSREWQNVGYWKDLGQVLQSYSRLRTRTAMPNSISELLELTHALNAQIEPLASDA